MDHTTHRVGPITHLLLGEQCMHICCGLFTAKSAPDGSGTASYIHITLGWSHTKLVWSELVCTLMAAYVFHRVLHMFQGGNIDILSDSLSNDGMVPASIFDITRSALTCSQRARRQGSDNAFLTMLYGKYFAVEHTFFQV